MFKNKQSWGIIYLNSISMVYKCDAVAFKTVMLLKNVFPFLFILKNAIFTNMSYDYPIFV